MSLKNETIKIMNNWTDCVNMGCDGVYEPYEAILKENIKHVASEIVAMTNNRKPEIEIIAKAIGYHFWKPANDQDAVDCGMDCAKDIIKALGLAI